MAFYVSPPPVPPINSGTENITANPGGGQLTAVPLGSRFNHVSVCATSGDSVKLPPYLAGIVIHVSNDGAANLAVFPNNVDRISTLGASNFFMVAPNKAASFTGTGTPGKWFVVHSA